MPVQERKIDGIPAWATLDFTLTLIKISYSELDYRLIFRTLVKGLNHKVLDSSDEISLSILKGMSHKITETITDDGLLIEIA